MSEITIGEHRFILGTMPARKQFHVARRLAPLLASLLGGADGATKPADLLGSVKVAPIAEALSTMSDQDADYILDACLGVVRLEQHDRAVPIMASNGRMQFDCITMPMMLQLAAEVIQRDLAGFMQGAGSGLAEATG